MEKMCKLKDLPRGTRFHFQGGDKHRGGPNTDFAYIVVYVDEANNSFTVVMDMDAGCLSPDLSPFKVYGGQMVYPIDPHEMGIKGYKTFLKNLKPGDKFKCKQVPKFTYILQKNVDSEGRWLCLLEGNAPGTGVASYFDPELSEVIVFEAKTIARVCDKSESTKLLTSLFSLKPGERFKTMDTRINCEVLEFDPDGRVWVVQDQYPLEDPRCKTWFPGQLKVEISDEVRKRMQGDLKPVSEAIEKIKDAAEEQRQKDSKTSKIRLQNLAEGDCYRVQTRDNYGDWKTIFEDSNLSFAEAVYNWNRSILLYDEDSWKTEYEE